MTTPLRLLRYGNGTVQRVYPTWVETDIPGFPTLYATPQPGQEATAWRLGYRGDVDAMTRDHDVLHAVLADWMGLPASFALVEASGGMADPALAAAEEEAVMALQRFARLAGVAVS